jgi:hypothetical protein
MVVLLATLGARELCAAQSPTDSAPLSGQQTASSNTINDTTKPQTTTPDPNLDKSVAERSSQDSVQGPVPTSSDSSDQTSQKTSESQYAPSLDGSGLIAMTPGRRIHALLGGAVSTGFDSNPDNLGTSKGSTVYSYSPYVGLQAATSWTEYLFQYHPTFTRYNNYANQSMQTASAAVASRASERLNWSLGINGSHGDDSVRLLAPSQTVPVGGVPTTGPNSGSYLPNAGQVTNFDIAFDLHQSLSPRNTLTYRLSDSYLSYPALHDIGKVATVNVVYERSMRPTLGFVSYAQNSRYYGDLLCTTVGGGVGLRWQPRENTLISFRGGPQFDTASCKAQQGFAYNVSFTTKVVGRAQLFFSADRVPVAGFLGAGLWQDDVTGGYERQIRTHGAMSVSAGYVHSSTLLNVRSYGGVFFDASYRHDIRKELSLACSYRSFNGSSGGVDVKRNTFFVSLTLTPNSHSLGQ